MNQVIVTVELPERLATALDRYCAQDHRTRRRSNVVADAFARWATQNGLVDEENEGCRPASSHKPEGVPEDR